MFNFVWFLVFFRLVRTGSIAEICVTVPALGEGATSTFLTKRSTTFVAVWPGFRPAFTLNVLMA